MHAKYLGIHLGPRSADFIWTDALDKYVSRVQAARTTGAGLLTSVIEYNTMCITTLDYIGQYCITDAPVLAAEARMLQRLTGCPRYTFTKEALWSLDALGMGQSFKSIKVCNMAAMTRMALQTTTVFSKMKATLDEAVHSDNSMLVSLVTGEVSGFDTPAIVNPCRKQLIMHCVQICTIGRGVHFWHNSKARSGMEACKRSLRITSGRLRWTSRRPNFCPGEWRGGALQ